MRRFLVPLVILIALAIPALAAARAGTSFPPKIGAVIISPLMRTSTSVKTRNWLIYA